MSGHLDSLIPKMSTINLYISWITFRRFHAIEVVFHVSIYFVHPEILNTFFPFKVCQGLRAVILFPSAILVLFRDAFQPLIRWFSLCLSDHYAVDNICSSAFGTDFSIPGQKAALPPLFFRPLKREEAVDGLRGVTYPGYRSIVSASSVI